MSARFARSLRSVGLALVAAVVLTACQLRTEVNVSVTEDGSGTVEVALALDEEAASRRPDLADELEVDDLVATGWEVTGPAEEADGWTWIRARHDFGDPAEVALLVDEIAGPDGPFRDFRLQRADGFAETSFRFEGVVDFTGGLDAAVADRDLAETLGAEPLELLDERLEQAIDRVVQVQVAVRLPGTVESNAPTRASNGAVWRPSVVEPEPVELRATSTVTNTDRLVWTGIAALAGLVLVVLLVVWIVRRRRRRRGAAAAAGS